MNSEANPAPRKSMKWITVFLVFILPLGVYFGLNYFSPKIYTPPSVLNFIETAEDGNDLVIIPPVLEYLEKNNVKRRRDFLFSYTNGINNAFGGQLLAKQAFSKTPCIVIAIGDQATEAAISENKDPKNIVFYLASKDYSKNGEIGFINCKGKITSEALAQKLAPLIVKAVRGEKVPRTPFLCAENAK